MNNVMRKLVMPFQDNIIIFLTLWETKDCHSQLPYCTLHVMFPHDNAPVHKTGSILYLWQYSANDEINMYCNILSPVWVFFRPLGYTALKESLVFVYELTFKMLWVWFGICMPSNALTSNIQIHLFFYLWKLQCGNLM